VTEPRPGDESDWSGWTRLPVARWLPDDRLELVQPATFRDHAGEVWTVPAGFRCDLASFPWWPFWVVGLSTVVVPVPDWLVISSLGLAAILLRHFRGAGPPGILHDHLYATGAVPKRKADRIFRWALIVGREGSVMAWIGWLGVAIGGWPAWWRHRRRGRA